MIYNYLDFNGLSAYDQLLKKYIEKQADNKVDANVITTSVVETVQDYVNLQIENSILGIETAKIQSLFKEPVLVEDIAADLDSYIDTIQDNQILVLVHNGEYEEELSIANDVYINGNGSNLSGVISVTPDSKVTIENAVISTALNL
jgi:hypothetical protein